MTFIIYRPNRPTLKKPNSFYYINKNSPDLIYGR